MFSGPLACKAHAPPTEPSPQPSKTDFAGTAAADRRLEYRADLNLNVTETAGVSPTEQGGAQR